MAEQQDFPPVIVLYDATFNAPIDAVFNCISDFGGWCKWTSSLTDMKIEGDGVDRIGCIRKFQSVESKGTYQEKEEVKDAVNHIFKFSNVSADPPIVFLKSQLVTATLTPDGDDKCSLHYEVVIQTNMQLPEEKVTAFQVWAKKTYDRLFGDLKNFVEKKE